MGICCPAEDQGPQTLQDLPAPTVEGVTDMYRRYELETVFARTAFGPFQDAVNRAAGEEEFVTFEALAQELNTPLWKSVNTDGSALKKLLEQPCFQSEHSDLSQQQIDKTKLIIFGLLNCVDAKKPVKKATAFYNILQDGGFDAHAEIAAGDKDFKPAFKAFVEIAGKDIMDAARATDGIECPYTEDDFTEIADNMDEVAEDFLEDIFGPRARTSAQDWIDKATTDASWVFDPSKLRDRIVEKASLDIKHKN